MSFAEQFPPTCAESVGMRSAAVAEAVRFAMDAETAWPRELDRGLGSGEAMNESASWSEVLGPTRPRGGPNGVILRGGREVARWGDCQRVDMTFSVAKSYLAILAGVACQQGLIRALDEPVIESVPIQELDSGHNRAITWRHLLHQTSEWEGTLWSKPDLVDRNRQVGANADNSRKGTHRELGAPGSFWEYNDVRVNLLSLCLLHRFEQPLAEVLRKHIMQPIGASESWEWLAYREAVVEIGGVSMPSVPGGAHWGGGIFISSEDQARVGYLLQRDGMAGDAFVLDPDWIRIMREPCALNRNYGCLLWLNSDRTYHRSAPETSFFMMGAGRNVVWMDVELDLTVVVRWIDAGSMEGFCERLMAAID